jgi:D-glycero-D-manno-heptose 1,7-bisphosphate phosphatase
VADVRMPAVFIDRDGTLIEERGYLDRLELIQPYDYAVDAIHLLKQAGYRIVVVTNQAGVARGRFAESFVNEAHAYLQSWLGRRNAALDGYYYCPHHPEGTVAEYAHGCDCRKPSPGMVQRAAAELNLDVAHSYVVGDKWLDMGLARNAGARGILVRTGYGRGVEGTPPAGLEDTPVVDDLLAAARLIVT